MEISGDDAAQCVFVNFVHYDVVPGNVTCTNVCEFCRKYKNPTKSIIPETTTARCRNTSNHHRPTDALMLGAPHPSGSRPPETSGT